MSEIQTFGTIPILGTVVAPTHDGRAGVVRFDRLLQGHEYGVINGETRGRISLMNHDPHGRVSKGVRVRLLEGRRGSEGWEITSVALATSNE